jgi:voltage-gated sodium channel
MFTVEGWNEIPASIIADSDDSMYAGLTRFYFVLVVLFGGIFGMSLANAVFVDEMTMDNNDELEKKVDELSVQVAELKEMLIKREEK